MADAKRDNNQVTTLLALSSSDGVTPVPLYADPTTHRLLVSSAAGALSTLSDVTLTSVAQGDILYYNGTKWVNLAHGTSGQFLQTQGASANPQWATVTAGAAGSNTQVQYNSTGSLAGAAGFTFDGTSVVTLGVAGTSVGAVAFKNATSGTITLQPVTGALGTITISLPATSGTVVTTGDTGTVTNGMLAGSIAASKLVGTDIATVGTITSGTWSATTIAINKGGTGVTSVTTAPTASAWAGWDANSNISANNIIDGFTTTATAAGTTTLTIASTGIQVFTGTTTQTVKLPTTSVVAGGQYTIINNSTGAVTVQSSGANTITVLGAGTSAIFTAVVATPTTAANWNSQYLGTSVASGKVLTVSNTLTLTGTDGSSVAFGTGGTVAYTANNLSVFAATTSAQLAGVISDETGSGALVFGTSPTITTPTINQINASASTAVKINAGSYQPYQSDTDGATVTFDLSVSNVHTVTLGGNRTLALSNANVGQCFILNLVQDATGSRTVTWFTTIKWAGGSAPTLTTTASKADSLGFICTSAGNYYGFVIGQNI